MTTTVIIVMVVIAVVLIMGSFVLCLGALGRGFKELHTKEDQQLNVLKSYLQQMKELDANRAGVREFRLEEIARYIKDSKQGMLALLESYLSNLDGYYAKNNLLTCVSKCQSRRKAVDDLISDKAIKIMLDDPRVMERIMNDIRDTIEEEGEAPPVNSEELEQSKEMTEELDDEKAEKTCGSCNQFDTSDPEGKMQNPSGECMMGRDDDGIEKANNKACAEHMEIPEEQPESTSDVEPVNGSSDEIATSVDIDLCIKCIFRAECTLKNSETTTVCHSFADEALQPPVQNLCEICKVQCSTQNPSITQCPGFDAKEDIEQS